MIDKTWPDIVRTLFRGSVSEGQTPEPRLDVLVAMILDLLMEVEALRSAQLAANGGAGGSASTYGRAYRDTAYLTHNFAGTTSGLDKLLARFYPAEAVKDRGAPGRQRTWRECLMLRRLGFSEEQVRTYQEDAEQAETFT